MTYDLAGQGWEAKSGYTILEIAYKYDMVHLPKSGADFFRIPSHIANSNYDVIGCLTCDGIGSKNTYDMLSFYCNSRPVAKIKPSYDKDPKEGRQSVDPNKKIEVWTKDYNNNWHKLGLTDPSDETQIFRFDFLSEIYYEDSMDLPSTLHNHIWVKWIRTSEGWKKPQDVLDAKEGNQATWAKMTWSWENKEIHYEGWIEC